MIVYDFNSLSIVFTNSLQKNNCIKCVDTIVHYLLKHFQLELIVLSNAKNIKHIQLIHYIEKSIYYNEPLLIWIFIYFRSITINNVFIF